MALISAIIPVYNAASSIRDCVGSVMRAGASDIEVILIDDGSTDGGGAICDSIATADRRVRVIHQDNSGAAAARKRGVEDSSGRWITFLDADDTLEPGALGKMLAASGGCDIVVGHCHNIPYRESPESIDEYRRHTILNDDTWPVAPWAHLYSGNLFNGFEFDIPRSVIPGEDWIMNIRLAFACKTPVGIVCEKVYNYRRNDSSLSGRCKDNPDRMMEFRKHLLASVPENLLPEYMESIALSEFIRFDNCVHSNRGDRSFGSHPFTALLKEDMTAAGTGFPKWMSWILKHGNSVPANRLGYWFKKLF